MSLFLKESLAEMLAETLAETMLMETTLTETTLTEMLAETLPEMLPETQFNSTIYHIWSTVISSTSISVLKREYLHLQTG